MTKILYKQIVHDLKHQIDTGQLVEGDQLPTEHDLTIRYGVSRITSKRALVELETAGLIYRIQGRGSFVSTPPKTVAQQQNLLFLSPLPTSISLEMYAEAMTDYLHDKPYHLSLQSSTLLDREDTDYFVANYAGVILYPASSHVHLEALYQLMLKGFPVVLMDKKIDGLNLPTITSANYEGGYLACQHLINKGHTHILFVTKGLAYSSTIRERYHGYASALAAAGLGFHGVGIFSVEDMDDTQLEQHFLQIVRDMQTHHVTGIIAENDVIAMYLLKLAQKHHLSSPKDFAIVGFDNLHIAALFSPSITTIQQNFGEIGRRTVETVLALIQQQNQGSEPAPHVVIDVTLIERETTEGCHLPMLTQPPT